MTRITKTYSACIMPMRHDDPRRATQKDRGIAAKASAEALKSADLPMEYRHTDRGKVDDMAASMREALRPIGRDVHVSEVCGIPLRF